MVETAVAHLFLSLLGANHNVGMELYTSLDSDRAKKASLRALGISRLSAKEYNMMDAIIRLMESHEKIRNTLVHWVWAKGPDIQDSMTLMNPKIAIRNNATRHDNIASGKPEFENYGITSDDVFIYSAASLEIEEIGFHHIELLIYSFIRICLLTQDDPERRSIYDEISQDARLGTYLSQS